MRLVSLTMVKNEEDIIEAFIRFHQDIFSHFYIIDNFSNDRTVEIVLRLEQEGFPITLFFEDTPAFEQSDIITNYAYKIYKKDKFDFVFPIDVDEFVTSYSFEPLQQLLKAEIHDFDLVYYEWITYVPVLNDNYNEINPIVRINHKRVLQNNSDSKIIISGKILAKYGITIKQGSHEIIVENENPTLKRKKSTILGLAHFPIRTIEQAKSKYVVGWLTNLARKEQVLFDWLYYYNKVKGDKQITLSDIESMAKYYGIIDKDIPIELVSSPLRVENTARIELKYTLNTKVNFSNNLLQYTELLAQSYSKIINHKTELNDKAQIYSHIKEFHLIDGWLSISEAIELYSLASLLPKDKEVVVCEIGVWQGKSTYVLAKALENHPKAKIYCIDPFNCDGDEVSKPIYSNLVGKEESLFQKFEQNLMKFGIASKVEIIKDYSWNVSKTFSKEIDLLFIDGNHDYEFVLKDYNDWNGLITEGGYIAFHDVGAAHTTGPKRVIENKIYRNSIWEKYKLCGSLFCAKKKSNNLQQLHSSFSINKSISFDCVDIKCSKIVNLINKENTNLDYMILWGGIFELPFKAQQGLLAHLYGWCYIQNQEENGEKYLLDWYEKDALADRLAIDWGYKQEIQALRGIRPLKTSGFVASEIPLYLSEYSIPNQEFYDNLILFFNQQDIETQNRIQSDYYLFYKDRFSVALKTSLVPEGKKLVIFTQPNNFETEFQKLLNQTCNYLGTH